MLALPRRLPLPSEPRPGGSDGRRTSGTTGMRIGALPDGPPASGRSISPVLAVRMSSARPPAETWII